MRMIVLFFRICAFEITIKGIVVRNDDALIHTSAIGTQVGGAEHIVDAYKDGVTVERTPDALPGGHVCVSQSFGHTMTAVRDRSIVEIAAYNSRTAPAMRKNVAGHRISLHGAGHGGFGYLRNQLAYALFHRSIVRIFHYFLIHLTVSRAEFVRRQMIVDNEQGIALLQHYFISYRRVETHSVDDFTAYDRVFRKAAKVVVEVEVECVAVRIGITE